jgi:hypothetical protein
MSVFALVVIIVKVRHVSPSGWRHPYPQTRKRQERPFCAGDGVGLLPVLHGRPS